MSQRIKIMLLIAAGTMLTAPLMGCHNSDNGLTSAEQQQSNRLDEIAKKSGGDWDKVSPDDRTYLIKNIAHGSERSARMLLMMKGGRLKATPGGPPKH